MFKLRWSLRRKKPTCVSEASRPHQWQADEEAVRKGECNFPVQYLGSVEVEESRGMHVCEEAVEKLKVSGEKTVKAVLWVSANGLRVVDDKTKDLIVDQTIEKVSFCSPDRNYDKAFSYICRDRLTRRWMCHCFMALKDSGERLSHAVGCAFAACLERKQRREKECDVMASSDASRTSFMDEGSFWSNPSCQQSSSSERDDKLQDKKKDQPSAIPALPPGTASPPEGAASPMERPEPGRLHAIPRRHAPIEQLARQDSFQGFPALSQKNSPFKRQLSLRLNDLPSTLQRKTNFQDKNPAGKPSAGATGVDTMAEEKQRPSLIQRVETMTSVIELLLETLAGLSDWELREFEEVLLSQTDLYEQLYLRHLKRAHMQDRVFLMVQTDGQQSVETTKKVLKKMKRTDLVQILSDSSSGPKKKHSVDEHLSALIHKVATMRAFKELLLETLGDLSNVELKKFKCLLQFTLFQRNIELISWRELHWFHSVNILVDVMLERCGQQSVEVTKEVLIDMNRTDLVQRLPETSSGHKVVIKCAAAAGSSAEAFGVRTTEREKHCVDEHWPALIQKVEMMTSVIELLLETLAGLSDWELREFKEVLLSQTDLYTCLSVMTLILREIEDEQDTVFLMVLTYGQQSVETTQEVLKKMKRTDLVQRLSDSSKGPKKQHSDEHRPALIQKVATMAAVKQLLLETLNDLSDKELKKFKWYLEWTVSQKNLPDISPELSDTTDRAQIVDVMLQTYSQQSVQLTREVVKEMNRTDLMQRLLKPSSELKEKHSVDEHQPAVLERAAVNQILLETLKDLSYEELEKFQWLLRFTQFQKGLPHISLSRLQWTDSADPLVDLMVQTCGQQSVEVTKEVFMDMNRTDLVNKLSVISSRIKEKHPSELLQKEVTMTPLMEKLLETLEDLSRREFWDFKRVLLDTRMKKGLPEISTQRMWMANRVEIVELMVEIYGQQSVEVTREVLMEVERYRRERDFFSPFNYELKGKRLAEPLQKEVTKTPLMEKLLETLEDLSPGELEKFKHVLQYTKMEKDLPKIPGHHMEMADKVKIVELMVKIYGQQSVEVTCKVLRKMNRTDLAEMLSGTSSGLKEKHQSKPLQKVVTRTSLMEKLLETLKDLSYGELEQFKHVLHHTRMKKGLPKISSQRMEMADRDEIVKLMVEIYGEQSVEVTREVLMEMNRTDLAERLSEISSGSKGPSRSLELEGCGSIMQDSSDWTKVEPEVNSTDANKASTYSLQSGAGKFECSVSGMRWVCKEKVSFKYQFYSWEGPMERIESMKYMPAGPLMDITVTAGKLDVVYLPHWIAIDDNPTILDKFAVLHIDDCGDVVEKVSEVTSSHVKLSEPDFSPRAVLMKVGVPVKIHCNVLIYKTNTAFLTLHVYLIPCDPGLQEEMDKRELSYGYKIIRKPHPERSLKMQDRFILTADLDSADITPKTLKLRYKSRNPNFFEVFIENPDKVFELQLEQENDHQPVWTCAIRKDDYQSSTGPLPGEHFVDKHQCALIERVSNIKPILDSLLSEKVIQQEEYDTISAIPTTQEKMRKLYSGALKAAGHDGKDVFYKILEEKETYLVADLKRKES